MVTKRDIGTIGEDAALTHLRKLGYKLIQRNIHLGRHGELDLVMMDGQTLVFTEVKACIQPPGFSDPATAGRGGFTNITSVKQRKLWELGQLYLQRHKGNYNAVRFDAVEVCFADSSLKKHTLRHLQDAFRL